MNSFSGIRNVTVSDRVDWDKTATHPLQSWAWGDFRQACGKIVERHGVFRNGQLIQTWQITFHKIPTLPFTIGYFPKGPIPSDMMIHKLTSIGRKQKAIYIQLEPNIRKSDNTIFENCLNLPNMRISDHPLFTKYTYTIDLTKTEDALLSAMHPKTRYNIRLAQKRGVLIKEDNSKKAFAVYLALSNETTKRQGFYAHDDLYQTTMWEYLHTAGIAKLFTATLNGTVLAAWIVFVYNNILYYPYGASSRDKREVMAPNLLLWELIRWGKRNSCTLFDLWGAMGPDPDITDPWYGFHRFKAGYNPELVEFIGSFDLVISQPLYRVMTNLNKMRWKILKLMR